MYLLVTRCDSFLILCEYTMSKVSWQTVACITVPAFLFGVSLTLVILLNNTTLMAPPVSPCVYSMDTRCKNELYRGVRWEDYFDGAGCEGCDESTHRTTEDSKSESNSTGKNSLHHQLKSKSFAPSSEVSNKVKSRVEGIRGRPMPPNMNYEPSPAANY